MHSAFRLVSFVLSTFLSFELYPILSNYLVKTMHLNVFIQKWITGNLLNSSKTHMVSSQIQSHAANNMKPSIILANINLPPILGDMLEKSVNETLKTTAGNITNSVTNALSATLTSMAINIISMLILFFGMKIVFMVLGFVLNGIMQLPILKEINKMAGTALGFVEGILTVYVFFAIMTFFSSVGQLGKFLTTVQASMFAKYFYNYNVLLMLLFGGKS